MTLYLDLIWLDISFSKFHWNVCMQHSIWLEWSSFLRFTHFFWLLFTFLHQTWMQFSTSTFDKMQYDFVRKIDIFIIWPNSMLFTLCEYEPILENDFHIKCTKASTCCWLFNVILQYPIATMLKYYREISKSICLCIDIVRVFY